MKKCRLLVLMVLAMLVMPRFANCAVTMSADASAPATGVSDQYDLADDATVPGGTTPGGGEYNRQAFSDNAGPPGQTFTTPNTAAGYQITSVSLKGANTGGGNLGGIDSSTTWGLRISSVSGTNLTPINEVSGISSISGVSGNEWFTWSFTDADALTLAPATQYAFEVYSSAGYLGFDADTSDGYAGGTAFNHAGSSRTFDDATPGDLASHGYDRTFHVGLAAVPEPATCGLALCSAIGLLSLRRRH